MFKSPKRYKENPTATVCPINNNKGRMTSPAVGGALEIRKGSAAT